MSAVAAPPATDRRVAPRFRPAFGTVCRLGPTGVGLVCNVSTSGVGMLVADPPAAGARLPGELSLEAGDATLAVGLRVVHVKRVETGDYFLGCQFDAPLAAEQLEPFLTPPPKGAWDLPKKG